MKENKKGRGQPTKYENTMPERFKVACALGATEEQLSAIFGVSCKTLGNWQKKHPDFLRSLKEGRAIADEAVEKALFLRATGYSHQDTHFATVDGQVIQTPFTKHYPPDTTACIFWLKNRQPQLWRDKLQTEVSGPDGGPIPLEVMTRDQIRAELMRRGAIEVSSSGREQGSENATPQ